MVLSQNRLLASPIIHAFRIGGPEIEVSAIAANQQGQFVLVAEVEEGSDLVVPAAFNVANSYQATLDYTITCSEAWLLVDPASGSSVPADGGDDIEVTFDADALAPGTHNATITVSDENALNDPQTIYVTLTVIPAPTPSSTAILQVIGVGSNKIRFILDNDYATADGSAFEVHDSIEDLWYSGDSVAAVSSKVFDVTYSEDVTGVIDLWRVQSAPSDDDGTLDVPANGDVLQGATVFVSRREGVQTMHFEWNSLVNEGLRAALLPYVQVEVLGVWRTASSDANTHTNSLQPVYGTVPAVPLGCPWRVIAKEDGTYPATQSYAVALPETGVESGGV